jgi:translocation and assembly module TamA
VIATLDIQYVGAGGEEPRLKSAAAAFELQPGDVLDHQRYQEAKERLLDAAYALGYAKAEPTVAKTVVYPSTHSAEMTLHIDTGPRYYFGEISFEQDFLDQDLVDEFVTIKPGNPFDNAQLIEFQQGLQSTDWASIVAVKPRFEDAEQNRVPIDVSLHPSKRHYVQFGLGYETDIGPRLTARWLGRRLNTRGHHADVYLRLSPVNSNFHGTYFIPVVNPRTDRASLGSQYEFEDTNDTKRSTFDLEGAFTRRTLDDSLFRKLFVDYKLERFKIGDNPWTRSGILSLGATARFTRLEDAFFTQRGVYGHADLRAASSALLSDTSFVRLDLRGGYLFPIGSDGRFLARGEVGLAWVEDFDFYPASLRYFAGGGSSIRGYDYKSLGPTNEDGNVEGGENLLVASGEYNHRVSEEWLAAVFVDAGNAYNDSLSDIHVGAGVGAGWLLGFGSLRVDVAWPVSDENWGLADFQIHLGFGAAL